jgi:hypothetical protein
MTAWHVMMKEIGLRSLRLRNEDGSPADEYRLPTRRERTRVRGKRRIRRSAA